MAKQNSSSTSTSSSSSSSGCYKPISIRIEFIILILLLVLMSLLLLDYPMKPSFLNKNINNNNYCMSTRKSENEDDFISHVKKTESPEKIDEPTSSPTTEGTNSELQQQQSSSQCDCKKQCGGRENKNNNKQQQVINTKDDDNNDKDEEEVKKKNNNKVSNNNVPVVADTTGSLNLASLFDLEKEASSLLFQTQNNNNDNSFTSLKQLKLDAISQLKDFFPPSFFSNIKKKDENNKDESDGETFLRLLHQLSDFVAQDHRSYSKLTRVLKSITTISRMNFVKESSNMISQNNNKKDTTSSMMSGDEQQQQQKPSLPIQLFRFHSSSAIDDDNALTVPSIPADLPNLEIVAPTNFGLVAGFSSPDQKIQIKLKSNNNNNNNKITSAASSSSSSTSSKPKLKIATVLTGHMRSYKRCAERLTRTVLGPTDSSLFIATYQDRGEKRYGKREQISNDDVMDWYEVEKIYSPHLKGLFVGEVPLLRRRLQVAFPKAFTNTQFSWMLYQFLLIEIGLNMTEATWRGWDFSSEVVGEMSFGSLSSAQSARNNIYNTIKSSVIASEIVSGGGGGGKNKNNNQGLLLSRNDDVSSGVWPWLHFWRNCGKPDAKSGECSLVRVQYPKFEQRRKRPYDIFIRLRPDLFIIGTIKLSTIRLEMAGDLVVTTSAADDQKAAVNDDGDTTENKNNNNKDDSADYLPLKGEFQLSLDCGDEANTARNVPIRNFLADMDDNVILVSPHHPVYEWILDKVSDLSQVATYAGAKKFLPMHSFLAQLSPQDQDSVFVPLCTAERLWNSRAKLLRMHQNKTFGWFAMLRNASTFRMGKFEGASSERRRQLVRKIFSITNPNDIGCPLEDGTMVTMPPHSSGSGKKSGKRGRG